MPFTRFGDRKVIVTCAVTGGSMFNRTHPNFPITPKQIAESAVEAARAGASIVHVHVRDPETGEGSYKVSLFEEVSDRIRQAPVDVVINLTCGGNARFCPDPCNESQAGPGTTVALPEVRYAHIEACKPEIATLDVTTSNQSDGGDDFVYLNTPRTLRALAAKFLELGVKPELEVFEAGDIGFANQLIAEGLVAGRPMFQFVLGLKWNAPALPETIAFMKGLLPEGAHWGALGTGRNEYPIAAQATLMGGNIRVGLEDNLYLRKGVFATNRQLVERAVQLIDILGHEVATPDEARKILGLPAR